MATPLVKLPIMFWQHVLWEVDVEPRCVALLNEPSLTPILLQWTISPSGKRYCLFLDLRFISSKFHDLVPALASLLVSQTQHLKIIQVGGT